MTKPSDDPAAALAEIRSIMQRSTRFIALSGLSGVATGLIALAGAAVVFAKLYDSYGTYDVAHAFARAETDRLALFNFLLSVSLILIAAAFAAGVYFTTLSARRLGYPVWDSSARHMLINLAVPLVAGGLFCLLLYKHEAVALILPSMLIFYGVALLNASKYSVDELRKLGMAEVAFGLLAGWWSEQALLFWAVGFGVLPVVYGILMYNRYERTAKPVNAEVE